MCFFRSWLLTKLLLGHLNFRFYVIIIYSCFLTSYNVFEQVSVVSDVRIHLFAIVTRGCIYWTLSNSGTNSAVTYFILKYRFTWPLWNPYYLVFSLIILLLCTTTSIFFTKFSSVMDMLRFPSLTCSLMSSRPVTVCTPFINLW